MKIKITSEVTTYIKTSTWHQDDYSSARWSCSSYCHGIPQKGWWSWIKWEHVNGNHENEKRKGAGFSDWYILYTKNIFIKLTRGIISHFEVTLMDNIRRAVWETKQHRNETKTTNSHCGLGTPSGCFPWLVQLSNCCCHHDIATHWLMVSAASQRLAIWWGQQYYWLADETQNCKQLTNHQEHKHA